MAKRVTNAQVAALLEQVGTALQAPLGGFSQEDHDALVVLVTKMEFVEKAAKRWDDNHTVVSNLKQRQGLILAVGGLTSGTVLGEAIRRIIDHFF